MHGAARKLERICQRASRELFQGVPLPNSRLLGPWLTLTLGTDAVSQDAPARVLPAGAVHAPLVSSQGGALACVSALGVVGTGQTRVTGAGPESEMMVQVARTRLLTLSGAFGVDLEVMKALDWHVHITGPAGPKDGASLGWPVLLAMASHLTGLKLPARYVHTGELGLNGEILPVGGIEEKVLACERQGLRRLFLPYGNRSDLDCLEPVAKGKLILVTIQQDADALKMLRVLSRRSS
jgi:ATP-dependent Lon protease